MLSNQDQMAILKNAVKEGYKGSYTELWQAADPEAQQENVEVADSPQEQEQGLGGRSPEQLPDAMVFPGSQGDFNTNNMQAPIDIEKYGKQGELVQSYKSVPPGIDNLPMGGDIGTVIERPAEYQTKGVKRPTSIEPYNGGYDKVTENSEANLANIEWNRQWINSPMHKEMLTAEDPENIGAITQARLKNLEGLTTRTHTQPSGKIRGGNGDGSKGALGTSNTYSGNIHLYPSDNYDPNLINIHEVSHSSDRPIRNSNQYDILSKVRKGIITKEEAEKQLDIYNTIEQEEGWSGNSFLAVKEGRLIPPPSQEMMNLGVEKDREWIEPNQTNEEQSYKWRTEQSGLRESSMTPATEKFQKYLLSSEGTEVRARLNAIRFKAQELGIYDPFTEKITEEQYGKLVDRENRNLFGAAVGGSKGSANQLDTLRQFFGDRTLMKMLNTISFNPEEDNQNSIRDEMPGESTMAKTGGFYQTKGSWKLPTITDQYKCGGFFSNSKVKSRKTGGFFNTK